MARSLEQLQKQYNKAAPAGRGGHGRGPGHGPIGKGAKVKDTKGTIKRLLAYLMPYKFRIVGVLFCMLLKLCAQ